MLIVGLTGGIATGKSTVSAMLQERGAHIVDADRIARQVVEPGLPGWEGVVEAFGREILLADGSIDRMALGRIVFNDSPARKRLDEIVHPFVFEAMAHELAAIETSEPEAIAVLDVPLLIESGMHRNLADVLLVYAPEPIQMRRLMARDRLSEEEALCRIRSQMPIEDKRPLATIVIDNSGDKASTALQVDAVFAYLVRKSKDPTLQWNN